MQLFESLHNATVNKPSAVALGYFDGVHVGHRAVIESAVQSAKQNGLSSAVFSFALPAKSYKGKAILTFTEKQKRLQSLGVQTLLNPNFDEFFAFDCETFVQTVLVDILQAKQVFCGADFTFGKKASGNVQTLQTLCKNHAIQVHIVPTVQLNGQTVSSTRIRQALAQGDMPTVNALLGQAYAVDMPVQSGNQLGRTMGLPTINQLYTANLQLPKTGVYITTTTVQNKVYASATGIGARPTVSNDNTITCETFICDFAGDLYGETPTVSFYQYLKPTQKFANKQELQEYIEQAAISATEYYKANF